jgi:NAD-dependent SIR2 family protein deacetylase
VDSFAIRLALFRGIVVNSKHKVLKITDFPAALLNFPNASLAFAAHNKGAVIIEVNLEPTPLTGKADFFLQGKSGEILPALVKAAWPD